MPLSDRRSTTRHNGMHVPDTWRALRVVPGPAPHKVEYSPCVPSVAELDQAMRESREHRAGRTVRVQAPPYAEAIATVVTSLISHAVGAGAAVTVVGVPSALEGPASLFECLCSGQAPVLSTSAASALAALSGRRSTQLQMLERLLRRHARHRPLVLVAVDAAALNPEAAWMLAQLSGLLHDAAVTWLLVEHDGELGRYPEPARVPPPVSRPADTARPGARVIGLRPSRGPVTRESGGVSGRHGERPRFGWQSLTEKEVEVARLIADGHTNRSAAEALFISTNTVSTHLRSVFAKLDVNSRVQLTRVALSHLPGSASAD